MHKEEFVRTAKAAMAGGGYVKGRRLVVYEGELIEFIEGIRGMPLGDVSCLAREFIEAGLREQANMLSGGKSAAITESLSGDEKDLIRGAVVSAAINGHPVSGLADLLAGEFRRIKKS